MPPLLSVIVPAYNVAQYLPDCLDSILNNTLKDIEVIVVDDGSPDECGEIAEDYAQRDSRVKVLHTENSGLGPARNNGAAIATGKYLMFVDSDDLVPSRAFEIMVNSLEETGSDIAAGNAWRYMEDKGNLPSWTHRQAMAKDRKKTHIREFPLLVRDRMAWNKVWRHSFWKEHEFAFPAIRYEDFPVVLKAHLLASSVDVISSRIYMWRQRESSTSITQRSADVDNVADRVRSAELVLDVADEAADPEILSLLHAYFIDVDLITVAEALAAVSAEDEQTMEELFLRLARRLKPQRKHTTRLARLMHRAGVKGDLAAVKAMANWRRTSDRGALIRSMMKLETIAMVPALVGAIRPKRSKVLAVRERRLRSHLVASEVVGDDLLITAAVKLRRSLLVRASVAAELVVDGQVHELETSVGETGQFDVSIEIRVPIEQAAHWSAESDGYLRARITLGPLRWRGLIPCAVAKLPPPMSLQDGTWLVASHRSSATSHLWLRRLPDATVGEIELGEDALSVRLQSQAGGHVALVRTAPSEPLVREVIDHVATFTWEDVARDDPADNPANGESFRPLVYLPTLAGGAVEQATEIFDEEDEASAPLSAHEQRLAADQATVDAQMSEATGSSSQSEDVDAEASRDGMESEVGGGDEVSSTLAWPIFALEVDEPVRHGQHQFCLHRTRLGAAEILMKDVDHLTPENGRSR